MSVRQYNSLIIAYYNRPKEIQQLNFFDRFYPDVL